MRQFFISERESQHEICQLPQMWSYVAQWPFTQAPLTGFDPGNQYGKGYVWEEALSLTRQRAYVRRGGQYGKGFKVLFVY